MSKKIYIICNGCSRRALDTSRLIKYFELNNYSIVENAEDADQVIFVSCAFNKRKEEQSFEIIDSLKGEKLIVVGCLPAIAPARFGGIFKGRFIITKNLNDIDQLFSDFKIKFSSIPDANFLPPSHTISVSPLDKNPSLAYLRISHGCLGNCAYCIFPRSIGRLRSKPIDICLTEYKGLLEKSWKKFLITADDTGSYGLDINSSLSDLLDRLAGIDENSKVSWCIEELHPNWVIKYRADLLKRIKEKKLTGLGCAIQSGSDRIINSMNRGGTSEEIIKIFLEFRRANPKLQLYAHIIVGFPSETDADLHATLNLIKKIRFNKVLIFAYSDMEGTISSKMEDKVEHHIIIERIKIVVDFLTRENIEYGGDVSKTEDGFAITSKL